MRSGVVDVVFGCNAEGASTALPMNRSSSTLILHSFPDLPCPKATYRDPPRFMTLWFTCRSLKMRKAAIVLATVGAVGVSALAAPTPAEARWRGGFGPALAGGLIGAAIVGGLASSAYAWGPGYGYYGYPGYYGGYSPAYYGGYGYYDDYPYYSYPRVAYAPAYYGYRYRRVVRPAYAFYGGPRHYRVHRHYRHW
jgi:hypothetical protein